MARPPKNPSARWGTTPRSRRSPTSAQMLYTYFKQNFAQVTNPPIDPIREKIVMSLVSIIGPRPNLFDLEGHSTRKRLEVHQPILTDEDLEKIREIDGRGFVFPVEDTSTSATPAESGASGMKAALQALRAAAEQAVRDGVNIIILSDRPGRPRAHSYPRAACDRRRASSSDPQGPCARHVGLVVETGEAREVHHFALSGGLRRRSDQSISCLRDARRQIVRTNCRRSSTRREVVKRYTKAVDKGIAQGNVQDGHLDLPVLLRRADFRRGRPLLSISSPSSSRARRRKSRASGSMASRRR